MGLRTLVEAEHETFSQKVQTLQKMSRDHFSRITKLEARLDTEASICKAKFDELGASLKSECLKCQELTATVTHELEQMKLQFNRDDATREASAISLHQLTSSHRELSASRLENQKMDTERVSQLGSPLEADLQARCLGCKAAEESLRLKKRCT